MFLLRPSTAGNLAARSAFMAPASNPEAINGWMMMPTPLTAPASFTFHFVGGQE